MRGRKKPYTYAEIEHLKCIRCGSLACATWNICSDNGLYRPVCRACDIDLNRLVLQWAGFPDWEKKIAAYVKSEYGDATLNTERA